MVVCQECMALEGRSAAVWIWVCKLNKPCEIPWQKWHGIYRSCASWGLPFFHYFPRCKTFRRMVPLSTAGARPPTSLKRLVNWVVSVSSSFFKFSFAGSSLALLGMPIFKKRKKPYMQWPLLVTLQGLCLKAFQQWLCLGRLSENLFNT